VRPSAAVTQQIGQPAAGGTSSTDAPVADPAAARVSSLTERELIARIRARLPPAPDWVALGIGDDAAVVEPTRNRLEVLSVDAVVEGVHFDRAFTPPRAIGHRALAANLSDLAAMGASPRLALLSLAVPVECALVDFDAIVDGICALAARFRTAIVGGNLTRIGGPLVVDIAVMGAAKRRQVLTRGGARPGDALYVSGSIGAAAAGLQILQLTAERSPAGITGPEAAGGGGRPSSAEPAASGDGRLDELAARFLYPEPRVRLGVLLGRNRAATACIDSSDGLGEAVRQLAEASGVGVMLDAEALPIDAAARRWFEARGLDPVEAALSASDDYELVFASRPRLRGRLANVERHAGVPIARIGVCTAEPGVVLERSGVRQPLPRGFAHFR